MYQPRRRSRGSTCLKNTGTSCRRSGWGLENGQIASPEALVCIRDHVHNQLDHPNTPNSLDTHNGSESRMLLDCIWSRRCVCRATCNNSRPRTARYTLVTSSTTQAHRPVSTFTTGLCRACYRDCTRPCRCVCRTICNNSWRVGCALGPASLRKLPR